MSAWFEKGITDPLNRLARLAEQVCFSRTRCNIDKDIGWEQVGERYIIQGGKIEKNNDVVIRKKDLGTVLTNRQ